MSLFSDPTRITVPMIKVTGYVEKNESGSVLLPYDPQSLDISFDNCVKDDNTLGASSGNTHFSKAKASELKVTFVLDDTTFSNIIAYGMPKSLIPDSADNSIKTLQQLSHSFNKGQPPQVTLKSMNMPLMDTPSGVFRGLLTSLKVKNELVDSLGNRVKAKVECSFKHVLTEAEQKASGGSVASVSQVVLIGAGTQLASVAFDLLGSVALTAGLAAANGLDSVRKPAPGSSVVVPPK